MIFVDASRYNNTPFRTGVETYSFHLINALVKLTPREIILVSPRKIPLEVPQLIISFPRLWTQVRLSWEVWKRRVSSRAQSRDLHPIQTLFIPSHQMPIIHPSHTIITIHDVAFKRFPECYGWASRIYLDWGARFAVKHAAKIIAPSQVTKDDLIEFYKADPQKIVVIPHGYTPLPHVISTEARSTATSEAEKSLSCNSVVQGISPLSAYGGSVEMTRGGAAFARNDFGPYFLFIGRIERKKNLMTLIKAFSVFNQKQPDFKLVIAGKPGIGGDEIIKTAKLNPNIVLMGYVDEPTKIALFKNAFAFVLPSLYEGFGFPLLEAMQFNLPIIASDIPASHEVAGEGALYFKPTNPNELAALMEQLQNQELRTKLTKSYPDGLAQYSWERCAKATWEVLNRID